MKRVISLALSVLLIIGMLPLSAIATEGVDTTNSISKWDGSIASGFAAGSGSENDPYIISTGSELAYLSKEVNNGRDFEGEYLLLANDIDLQNKPWTPIGKTSYEIDYNNGVSPDDCVPFSGTFDGNSHTIFNVAFGNNYPNAYMGLFAVLCGTIQNLYVENQETVYPKSQYNPTSFLEHHYYAGIVTIMLGGFLDNCHYYGNIESAFSACSGLVFLAQDSTIQNCTSSGSIAYDGSEPKYFAVCSGIATMCLSSKLENCINYMVIDVYSYAQSGGISYRATEAVEYINCVNCGDITSQKESAAGIVTSVGTADFIGCKNYGNITIYDTRNTENGAGGIIAGMGSGEIINCSNYGDIYVVLDDAAGILACPSGDIKIESCFNKGNITTQGRFAGGIIAKGWLDGISIKNCYNTGTIAGIQPSYIYSACGGISGSNSGDGAKILYCYNTGAISYTANTAGICYGSSGYKYDADFCYYLNNVSVGVKYNVNSNATIRKLTSSEMKLQQSFAGFDFKNTWAISPDKNSGYPYLKNNPEVIPIDASFITFSKTKNELEYPIFSEESFAKQLKVWIEESEYFQSFEKFLSAYTYEELLYVTVDIPVKDTSNNTAFNVAGQAQIKDLMAYIIFADRTQRYMNNVMINVKAKISSNDINGAYEYFFEKLKNFNSQYYYFQDKLNGGDAFNEGLYALLIAKTAMAVVDEIKVSYKNGETEFIILNKQGKTVDEFIQEHTEEIKDVISLKSYSYLTDIYKANLADDSEYYYYDDLKYYVLSGGDTKYLNPAYSSTLKGYSLIIKNSKFAIKALKDAGESVTAGSIISLGLDNLNYFSDHFDSKTAEIIKFAKEGYEYLSSATDVVKAVSSGSLLGVVSAAIKIPEKYVEEVKKVYQKAESTEAGWYAFTYYYLSKENPDLLNAMINMDTGSAFWNFDGMISYGFPCDYNDPLQNAIASYYRQKQAWLEHTYTPAEAFRLYLWNAANTLNRIADMDCETYKKDLIEFLLAKLNSEADNCGIKFKVETSCNVENAGTTSGNGIYFADSNVSIIAEANDGYTFTGWLDLTTGETVSSQNVYSFKATRDYLLSAQFISDEEDVVCLPAISGQSQNTSYFLGQEIQALYINASIDNPDDLSVSWYQTTCPSQSGGTLVYEGNSFVPSITEIGEYYYYAVVKNAKNPAAKVYSQPICLTIKKPYIIGLQISKEPSQKVYFPNEAFNETGMRVGLVYSDGSVCNISDYTVEYDFSSEGDKTVVIQYGSFSKQLSVQVSNLRSGTLSNDISFTYDKNTKELVYSGSGAMGSDASVYQVAMSHSINIKDIETVKIPNSITSLAASMFERCEELRNIVLPTEITSIPARCFMYCENIASIVLPENITYIGNYSFGACSSLESIRIPNSVIGIGRYAFGYCNNLSTVTYCGTREEWDAINKSSGNEPLLNAALQFHNMENGLCTICSRRIAGDMDSSEGVDHNDAIYLLLHVMFGEENYPLNGADGDIDCNGKVDEDDAVYLLLHALFGEGFYPLQNQAAPVKNDEIVP